MGAEKEKPVKLFEGCQANVTSTPIAEMIFTNITCTPCGLALNVQDTKKDMGKEVASVIFTICPFSSINIPPAP